MKPIGLAATAALDYTRPPPMRGWALARTASFLPCIPSQPSDSCILAMALVERRIGLAWCLASCVRINDNVRHRRHVYMNRRCAGSLWANQDSVLRPFSLSSFR
jgi:hypothetical protein